jgi:hypothetical protein
MKTMVEERSLPEKIGKSFRQGGDHLFFRVFGFVDAPFDLAYLLGDRNLFRTDLCTLPQGLTTPRPVFVIEESHPFLRTLIP